jgi:hypothetical protein
MLMNEIEGYQIVVSDSTEDLMKRVGLMIEEIDSRWTPIGGVSQLANGKITQVMIKPKQPKKPTKSIAFDGQT